MISSTARTFVYNLGMNKYDEIRLGSLSNSYHGGNCAARRSSHRNASPAIISIAPVGIRQCGSENSRRKGISRKRASSTCEVAGVVGRLSRESSFVYGRSRDQRQNSGRNEGRREIHFQKKLQQELRKEIGRRPMLLARTKGR